ncbi:MAG: hypothetical protein ACYDHN_01520 [Solirubrobacteraceae bacterium]
MRLNTRIALGAILICACMTLAAVAWAGATLSLHAGFAPDKLGASANLAITASFLSGTGRAPSPVTRFKLYAPAGLGVDVRGAGTCAAETLERMGPRGCPPDSRAGFGGGVGVLELPNETIRASYTLDLFFASEKSGHLRLLIYAHATAPIGVELVVVARQIPAPKPYGLGFSVEVPPISTFPGATNASIESAFVTVGAPNVAYYEPVHGRRKLVHLQGIVVPKRCPAGGFPTGGIVDFADGTTLTVNSAIPCPHS